MTNAMKAVTRKQPRRPLIGEATRRRAVKSVERCMHAILIAMNREHERCGVTRCARSRRCRGTACGRPAR
jgi:hypothetical protein